MKFRKSTFEIDIRGPKRPKTSKLSKKPKIIEIDLRSQKLRDTKRYRSQGGVPPNPLIFLLEIVFEPQITTHI